MWGRPPSAVQSTPCGDGRLRPSNRPHVGTAAFGRPVERSETPAVTTAPCPRPQKHKRRSPRATPSFRSFDFLILLYHIAIVKSAHYSVQAKIYISFGCTHIAPIV